MMMTFRWYGLEDPVKIEYIRQIPGVKGIVSALYDVPVGDVWPVHKIKALKDIIEANGMEFSVIESIPVHESIKMGKEGRDEYIANYAQSIRNMAEAGVYTLCYNFMPVFDWTRSDLSMEMEDGSTCLSYDYSYLENLDLRKELLDLPGWATNYTQEQINDLLDGYTEVGEEGLWENLSYFLKAVIPVAEEVGVKMAIHPDDPPWPIFGLPRIITNGENIERMLDIVDSPSNGVTFCIGSLGPDPKAALETWVAKFAKRGRIHFAHMRNIKITGEKCFYESAHPTEYGSLNMYEIIKTLHDNGFTGYIRPDHGRMIWSETGRPGYGLYDRALGATYLYGLWEAAAAEGKN